MAVVAEGEGKTGGENVEGGFTDGAAAKKSAPVGFSAWRDFDPSHRHES